MKLTIFFDHRYKKNIDGSTSSPTHYNYDLFKSRYLQVFDSVSIVARSTEPIGNRVSLGPGVEVVSVGTWNGVIDYLRKKPAIKLLLKQLLNEPTAALMIVPGLIGEIAHKILVSQGHPYALEVIGDPHSSLGPGTIKHPLRPLIRYHFTKQQKILCAQATCTSYVTEQALQKIYPPAVEAFSTHYSSIELADNHLTLKPKSYDSHQKSWRLINIGTMNVYYKGQDYLIKAVAQCRKRGLDINLTLLGDGAIRGELESLATQLGIRKHVFFLGHLPPGDSIRSELDQSDLFVLPSLTEGLPRALLEAMARGLACIGTEIPGIAELLEGDSLFPARNAEAMSWKILEFLENSTLLEQQAVRNHNKSKEYLSSILTRKRHNLYTCLDEATTAYYRINTESRKAA